MLSSLIDWLIQKSAEIKDKSLDDGCSRLEYHMLAGESAMCGDVLRKIGELKDSAEHMTVNGVEYPTGTTFTQVKGEWIAQPYNAKAEAEREAFRQRNPLDPDGWSMFSQ